jgi:S-formylglutathione hydrolase FrmB
MRARIRGVTFALAFVIAAAAGVISPASPASAAAPPALPSPNSFGITTTKWQAADSNSTSQWRYVDAWMKTSAIYKNGSQYEIKVRILLPPNYQPNKSLHAPYPVLYLLHGGSGNYDDWAADGDVRGLVNGTAFNGIVVLPEGGGTGYYTNWYGTSDNGLSPQWETFHINQLLPWVDANFNTSGTRTGRAIAGLSMGGFGALKYGGEHPDKFSAVASFSGGENLDRTDVQDLISGHMWQGGSCIRFPGWFDMGNCLDPNTRVNLKENGQIVDDEVRQRAYRMQVLWGPNNDYESPYDLAPNFGQYGGKFALYTGGNPSGETGMYEWNLEFHNRLATLGVSHRWCAGAGDHSWTYWKRDLTDFIAYVYGSPIACHYG